MTKNTKPPRGPFNIPGGPIDWDAWTVEATQPRGNLGRKRSPQAIANMRAGQRERFAIQRAKMAEALAAQRALEAAQPKRHDPLLSLTNAERVLGNMAPGQWYSTHDMHRISGVGYGSCKGSAVKWHKEGLLRRVQNPDWLPPERPGAPQEPKWLYGLSEIGEQRHRAAVALL